MCVRAAANEFAELTGGQIVEAEVCRVGMFEL